MILTGRSSNFLYKRAKAGVVRTMRLGPGDKRGREGTMLFYRPDVEALDAVAFRKRDSGPCRECGWYMGRGKCSVFVELWPEAWRTEDGGCQAYVRPDEPGASGRRDGDAA